MKATVTVIFSDGSALTKCVGFGGEANILGETLNTEFDSWHQARDFVIESSASSGLHAARLRETELEPTFDLRSTAEYIETINAQWHLEKEAYVFNYVFIPQRCNVGGGEWYVRLRSHDRYSRSRFMTIEKGLGPSSQKGFSDE